MLYIVNSKITNPFYDCTSMSDDLHVDYTGGLTLEQYKVAQSNPDLIAVSPEEFYKRLDEYRISLIQEFKEVSEEEYNTCFNCMPPKRYRRGRFFLGEGKVLDLFQLYFKADNDKFYSGLRSINASDDELDQEINKFLKNINPNN